MGSQASNGCGCAFFGVDVGFFSPLKRSWPANQLTNDHCQGVQGSLLSHSVVKLSTIVNAFKACGIYPELESAEVYQKTECCGETNCSSSFKPGASKLALLALAEELDKTTINRFMRRYEEGYDLTDDVLYIAWKKLKKASMRQPLTDLT